VVEGGGLDLCLRVLEPLSRMSAHFDLYLLAMGLLINVLELSLQSRRHLKLLSKDATRMLFSDFALTEPPIGTSALELLTGLYSKAVARDGTTLGGCEKPAMEANVAGAYCALLLGTAAG
jgi:hypothetical protein